MASLTRKVWLITGTSTGLGRELALAALRAGDNVIATARSLAKLADLPSQAARPTPPSTSVPGAYAGACYAMQLDVTDDVSVLRAKAAEAVRVWGRVDVLVNNAGGGMFGVSEEVGVEGYEAQFRTNFFGPLNVTYALLPYMRARRAGTVVFVGSRSSWRTNVPMIGTYAASKAALTAAAESLAVEVAPLGIRVLNVLPGGLRTANWDNMVLLPTARSALLPPLYAPALAASNSDTDSAITVPSAGAEGTEDSKGGTDTTEEPQQYITDYDALRVPLLRWMSTQTGTQPGDPASAASAIVAVVRGEARSSQLPENAGSVSRSGEGANEKNRTATKEGVTEASWPDLDMLVLGSDAEANIREKCARVVKNMDDWQDITRSVDLPV